MVTRAQIVAEARSWIGTPFHHQGHIKGIGCDCAGLLRGVMIGLGMADPNVKSWPGVKRYLGYSMTPDGVTMRDGCDQFLVPIDKTAMQPGDAVLMIVERFPQHLGILADYRRGGLSVIHSTNDKSHGRVIETRLMWSKNLRFVAAYAFPGIE